MFGLEKKDIMQHPDLDRAIALLTSGNALKALELAQRVSSENPGLALAHIVESGIAEKAGSHAAVVAACKRAIELEPERHDIYLRGILACLHIGNEQSASQFFAGVTPRVLATGTDLQSLWTLYQFAGQAFQPSAPVSRKLTPLPDAPLVSIVIATAGRPLLLLHALKSVLGQTYQNWEAIVVNARPDPLKLAVTDTRIKIIESASHLTAAEARNLGLDQVKGQLFCFLDDDDLFKANHLALAVTALSGQKVAGVFSDSDMVNERIVNGERVISQRQPGQAGREYSPYLMEMRNYVYFNEPVFRRDCCGALRFDTELNLWEDWDYLLAAFAIGPFGRVHASTCEVRHRTDDRAGHMSYRKGGSAAACDRIFARHPATRPWIDFGRQVFKRVQQVV